MDDSPRAQSFEGKTVEVTGRLEADTKLIHIDTIELLSLDPQELTASFLD
jgi:hypothetical protein